MNLIGHQKQWEFLRNKFEKKSLSHAYLFSGQEGIGKKLFAEKFTEFVGCKFPDLKIILKKEAAQQGEPRQGRDKTEISIAQIREVQNFLSYKSYNGGYKAVIVDDAHLMNLEAQNCFLKTLEEPKGETLLFLISSKPDLLLPTIFSRCQQMKFFRPKKLPENKEKTDREKEILKELLPILNASLAEKFKYVKSKDFSAQGGSASGGEEQSAAEIVQVLQKHLRQDLLKNKRILELTEEINNKLAFTNANPKLALEILLMEI